MNKFRKFLRWAIWTIFIVLGLVIAGLLAGAPVIPWVETSYFLKGNSQPLAGGYVIKQIDNAVISLEIPEYFSGSDQCIDIRFSSSDSSYSLTIENFTFDARTENQGILEQKDKYIFWDDGSNDDDQTIQNYTVLKSSENPLNDKYVFLRSVYNLNDTKRLIVKIKINFKIDGKPIVVEESLRLEKERRLSWNRLRVH